MGILFGESLRALYDLYFLFEEVAYLILGFLLQDYYSGCKYILSHFVGEGFINDVFDAILVTSNEFLSLFGLESLPMWELLFGAGLAIILVLSIIKWLFSIVDSINPFG